MTALILCPIFGDIFHHQQNAQTVITDLKNIKLTPVMKLLKTWRIYKVIVYPHHHISLQN